MTARIIRYYQVVNENGITIEDAHTFKQAKRIKLNYDLGKEK
jgi:hypothetical protein